MRSSGPRMLATAMALAGLNAAPGDGPAEYRTAVPGYRYEFPRDHFTHPEFQTEWWYYTGNVRGAQGEHFGYELTFFRQGMGRGASGKPPWGVPDLYLAHLALSDIGGQRFYHTERLNRPGPGFAGADLNSAAIWNGNWQTVWDLPPPPGLSTRQRLSAIAEAFSLDLRLDSAKPPVIHGENGVSQKAAGRGRASYYISFTRLRTSGAIELAGRRYQVEGASWMDHEFFTEQLDASQTGWDWFSIQFEDGSELMLFRIRHADGSIDPYSAGTYVDAGGRARHLGRSEFTLEPGATWASAQSGARYPVAWTIRVPPLAIAASVTTPLASQELTSENPASPSYWEGAIDIRGTKAGASAAGSGYLEMTGYDRAVRFGR
jgi:predicted secreted hydrolase